MAQKIYVVKRAEGEYDSYYEYLEKAYRAEGINLK